MCARHRHQWYRYRYRSVRLLNNPEWEYFKRHQNPDMQLEWDLDLFSFLNDTIFVVL